MLEGAMTRNRVLGLIGVIWGGAILLSRFLSASPPSGSGAYGAGRAAGLVFAILLLVVGGYYLFKKPVPK